MGVGGLKIKDKVKIHLNVEGVQGRDERADRGGGGGGAGSSDPRQRRTHNISEEWEKLP